MAKRLLEASSLLGGAVGAMTSAAAAICCIGPLAIALLGVNGAILAAAFKPYRFYLLGASLVLLAGASWSAYRPRRGRRGLDGAACSTRQTRWIKVILWTSVALWVAALAVQYLANRFWLKGGLVL